MKRFAGLLRDTWWLWVLFFLGGTLATYFISPVFASTYPISIFAFLYFGIIRYDENGNPKEM